MRASSLSLSLLFTYAAATNIVISNDDGWATAQIRQQFDALTSAGHNVSTLIQQFGSHIARALSAAGRWVTGQRCAYVCSCLLSCRAWGVAWIRIINLAVPKDLPQRIVRRSETVRLARARPQALPVYFISNPIPMCSIGLTLWSWNDQVVLSSPALNQSGKSSLSTTPTALTEPCEFDTCPTGSPAMGFNSSNSEFLMSILRHTLTFN